ncbi:DnaJ domain-containing protein, partial [Halolamina salina]
MPADLYDVLGVPDDAAAEELKRAYRERVRKYHPDVNEHPEGEAQFKLVKTAHDVLSDPAERKTYDRLGHHEYVEKHLDSLPPVSVFPDEDLPDDTTTDDGSTDSGPATSEPMDGAAKSTTGSAADTSTDTATSERSRGSTASTESTGGYGSTGSGTSTTDGSSSATETTTEQSSTGRSEEGAGTDRDSWDAAASSTRTATADASVPEGVRRRRGLKRWYGVVVLSLLLYVGGLGAYALPRRAAMRSFLGDVAA